MLLFWSEKKFRNVLREEIQKVFSSEVMLEKKDGNYTIQSIEGGEIIMPNPIKKGFDEGKIKSFGDIL